MAQVVVKMQNIENGTIYDLTNAITDIQVSWFRKNQAGNLTANFYNAEGIYIPKGSPLLMYVDGKEFFKGYFFENEFDRWKKTKIKVYDQLRYLKSNDSFIFKGQTATQILKYLASYLGLQLGTVEDTGYTISYMLEENKSFFDVISKALQYTLVAKGIIYNFYDDFGKLCITQANKMYANNKLAYGSSILDYKYKGSIDSDTYNAVKYVYDTEGEALGNIPTATQKDVIEQDAVNIAKWGKLQYYATVDDNLNPSQIQEIAKSTLTYYNRELRTIEFDAIGDISLRGGSNVYVDLGPDLIEGQQMSGFQLVDKVVHTFTNGVHKMHVNTRELETLSGWSNSWKV